MGIFKIRDNNKVVIDILYNTQILNFNLKIHNRNIITPDNSQQPIDIFEKFTFTLNKDASCHLAFGQLSQAFTSYSSSNLTSIDYPNFQQEFYRLLKYS